MPELWHIGEIAPKEFLKLILKLWYVITKRQG